MSTLAKKGHLIMIKTSIKWENIKVLNLYVPNNTVSKYIKQGFDGTIRRHFKIHDQHGRF